MNYLMRVLRDWRTKTAIVVLALAGLWCGTYFVSQWFNTHTLIMRMPIQSPVVIKARTVNVIQTPEPVVYLDETSELKGYICSKSWDCNTAWAIMQAESRGNAEALNPNSNHTIDIGCFQINTIHLVKGIKVSDLLDCHKNIDFAYTLYSQQHGFQAWVTFENGSYKKYLNN